jgi:ribose transport system permease protein
MSGLLRALSPGGRALAGRAVLVLAIFCIFAATIGGFATSADLYSILQAAVPIGLAALGIGTTILAGELDLSVGAVATCVGIVSVKIFAVGMVPDIVLCTLIGVAYGLLQGTLIAILRISSIVFTLGTLIALGGLAYAMSGQGSVVTLTVPQLINAASIGNHVWIFSPASLVLIGALILLTIVLGYTRIGREVYAIGGARVESRAAGVPEMRPIVLAFAISGGLAALAGTLASLQAGSGSADAFDTLLFTAVTAALIGGVSLYGGRGSAIGIFLGVLTLQFLLAALALVSAPFWASDFATGALLLAFLVIELAGEHSPARAALVRARIRRRGLGTGEDASAGV